MSSLTKSNNTVKELITPVNQKILNRQEYFLALSGIFLDIILQLPLKNSEYNIDSNMLNIMTHAMNLACCYLLLCLIRVIIPRNDTAFRVALTICFIFSTISHYVELARGYCLSIVDIYNFQSAMEVIGKYRLSPDIKLHLITALYCLLFGISYVCMDNTVRKIPPVTRTVIAVASSLAIIFSSAIVDKMGIDWYMYNDDSMTANYNGYIVSLASSYQELKLSAPKTYNNKDFDKTPEEYLQTLPYEKPETQPNVIMIMNESLADLEILGDLKAERDPLPYIHSLANDKNFWLGFTNVYVQGSNTTNTEYAALSGFSAYAYNSDTPPYLYMKSGMITPYSIVHNFKTAGYKTFGLHNFGETSYYRNITYKLMGFDDIRFKNDFKTEYLSYNQALPADAVGYEEILDIIKTTNKPVFTFFVTVQNHGGYVTHKYDDPIKTQWNDPELSAYLSDIEKSDQNFKELITQIDNIEEDTIVIMFGDHQPYINTLDELFDTKTPEGELKNNRFLTPVIMYSNYQVDFNQYNMPGTFMIQYLPAHIVEIADIPTNQWLLDLKDFEQNWPDNEHVDEMTKQRYANEQYYIFCSQGK